MTVIEVQTIRNKFVEGANLALKRLIERTKKEDGELVFSQNGRIVKVKARDLK